MLVLALTACGSVKYGGVSQPLTTPDLKYRLIDAIVHHEKLDAAHLTADDDRRIVQQVQVLQALPLQADGQLFRFDYIAGRPSTEHVVGTIDDHGVISLESHDPTQFPGRGGCPICLAATTRIGTPDGPILVSDLRAGMLVWTVDAGRRVAAPIAIVRYTPAPFGHRVIRVVLADGRAVVASWRWTSCHTPATPGTCCRSAPPAPTGRTAYCLGAPWRTLSHK